MNFLAILVAALVPLAMGTVWYSDKVLGSKWKAAAELNEEKLKSGNMVILLGSVFLLCVLLAMAMNMLVIHQTMIPGLFVNNGQPPAAGSEEAIFIDNFMTKYGHLHRTFTHGMVHGIINSILIVLPLVGINALFEKRGWKYIFIHFGYWLITFAIMGGIICAWK